MPHIKRISHYNVLSGCSKISFSGSLNAIIARHLVSAVYILLVAMIALLLRSHIFTTFFRGANAGVNFFANLFASAGFCVALVYLFTLNILTFFLVHGLAMFTGIHNVLGSI